MADSYQGGRCRIGQKAAARAQLLERIIFDTLALLNDFEPILEVYFFASTGGNEPVRVWLKSLSKEDRRTIGEDLKTAQFGWPLGMPLVRKLEPNLWEVRSRIEDGIARVLFTVIGNKMILLHGFVKKSQKTPQSDLETARKRLKLVEES